MFDILIVINSFLSRTALTSSSVLANEHVKPERQKELEIGTDMSFFKDRIALTFNWYRKRVEDMLFNRVIAPTNGFSSLLDNFGSLENKGFEILLKGTPVRNKDLQWDVTLVYNHNRNKVLEVGSSLTLLELMPAHQFLYWKDIRLEYFTGLSLL